MFKHLITLELPHKGDCYLLGISPDMHIFTEEVYGDDERVAQHTLTMNGSILASAYEQDDPAGSFVPMRLPDDLIQPAPVPNGHPLNYSGPRLRGLREADHIAEIVRPLSLGSRMTLIHKLSLDLTPPMLLGVAESVVLAQTFIHTPAEAMICRRLRLAYALPHVSYDADNQPYDYDVLTLYAVHTYNVASGENVIEPELAFAGLPGAEVHRPMDCLAYNDHFLVADGGGTRHNNRIHVWQVVKEAE